MINYVIGDATKPSIAGNKIIAHICNDVGGWGKGFVLSLSKSLPKSEIEYRKWANSKDLSEMRPFKLGEVQFVKCAPQIIVANMVAQSGIGYKNNIPPIRYDFLRECLHIIAYNSPKINASIHMPRIGCGLAGGKWEIIKKIIDEELIQKNIEVYVYDLK